MASAVEAAVVRKSVRVQAPIERAFSVFVEQMETWWPATHHIGKTPFEAIFVSAVLPAVRAKLFSSHRPKRSRKFL